MLSGILIMLACCTNSALCDDSAQRALFTQKTYGDSDYRYSYLDDLQRRVSRDWQPPKNKETLHVTVEFNIDADGEMHHLKVTKSSGDPAVDQSGLAACNNAAPFCPLPAGAKPPIRIQFEFDYNCKDHGKASHLATN
jgi:TonB family protein